MDLAVTVEEAKNHLKRISSVIECNRMLWLPITKNPTTGQWFNATSGKAVHLDSWYSNGLTKLRPGHQTCLVLRDEGVLFKEFCATRNCHLCHFNAVAHFELNGLVCEESGIDGNYVLKINKTTGESNYHI